jgi:cobalt/nickel transport system permease protein
MNRNTRLALIALVVIAVVGIGLSQLASPQPDGLEFVAEAEGFDSQAVDHSLGNAPLADYGGDDRGKTVIAAGLGIAVTLGIGFAVFKLIGTKPEPTSSEQ